MDTKKSKSGRAKGMGLFSKKKKSNDKTAPESKQPLKSQSLPNLRLKSNMRVATLDQSLHTSYYKTGGLGESTRSAPGPVAHEKTIEFGKVVIREYERIVGDNPSCSSGVPVSIGWEYDPSPIEMKVDVYEDSRPPRRTPTQMLLPRSVRESMLKKEWGVKQSQIASAVRQNIKVKNQRRRTVTNLSKSTEKVEEKMENLGRNLKKSLRLGKGEDALFEEKQ